jgi:Ni/Co efflux regulator RcnB
MLSLSVSLFTNVLIRGAAAATLELAALRRRRKEDANAFSLSSFCVSFVRKRAQGKGQKGLFPLTTDAAAAATAAAAAKMMTAAKRERKPKQRERKREEKRERERDKERREREREKGSSKSRKGGKKCSGDNDVDGDAFGDEARCGDNHMLRRRNLQCLVVEIVFEKQFKSGIGGN